MVSGPGLYSLLSILIVGGLGLIYANLEPRYRLADPSTRQGAGSCRKPPCRCQAQRCQSDRCPDRVPQRYITAPEALTITEVHATVEKQPGIANVWSLETLRRWLADKAGRSDVVTLKQYVDMLPENLMRRFISVEQDAVLVSGRVPDTLAPGSGSGPASTLRTAVRGNAPSAARLLVASARSAQKAAAVNGLLFSIGKGCGQRGMAPCAGPLDEHRPSPSFRPTPHARQNVECREREVAKDSRTGTNRSLTAINFTPNHNPAFRAAIRARFDQSISPWPCATAEMK
jgi:hypothetical protein